MMLENIFLPLIEATMHPEEHPEVAELLKHIVGFDSVDDEGNPESGCSCTSPKEWTTSENPAYSWQLYYLWANIKVVNALRESKGLNTFALRPHAGETGDVNHLAATYMLCESINHGINLDKQVRRRRGGGEGGERKRRRRGEGEDENEKGRRKEASPFMCARFAGAKTTLEAGRRHSSALLALSVAASVQ